VKTPAVSSEIEQIAGSRAAAHEEAARLRNRAAQVAANLGSLSLAAESAIAKQLSQNAAALHALAFREAGPFWFDWDDPAWQDFAAPADGLVFDHIRIGRMQERERLPGDNANVDIAALVPMLAADGALLIRCTNDSKDSARALMQNLLLRLAIGMPSDMLFTLLDPQGLGVAFPYRGALAQVRPAGRTGADELNEVVDDIRRINEHVVGHAERFSQLSPDQRAGDNFEIVAAADFPRAYARDPRAIEHLLRIGNSGPRAGRHLILEWNSDEPLPHDFHMGQFHRSVVIDVDDRGVKLDRLPETALQKRLIGTISNANRESKAGEWRDSVRPERFFTKSSERRVATPVGERLRFWLGDDDSGNPNAHAMLAGQIGSGKSYLLHVIITGLAARYSPDELQLVLIDGKQGVEFEVYRRLPHAQIVCLRTAPSMARSVLADFVAEMEHRYELFQAVGAAKLEEYRQRSGLIVPRKLLIVDEFQQLLDGDPETGGRLISRLLEKGRAAGTHLLLGSQTFNVQGLPVNATSHIHTRIALALAQDYIQSIQMFGAEGKRLIRDLPPSGQAVINDQSGRDGANPRGAVARFRRGGGEDTLADAVAEIVAAVAHGSVPVVLSGNEAAVLADNDFVVDHAGRPPAPEALQTLARRPRREGGFDISGWNAADHPVPFWLGRRFEVYGHALCALRRAPCQNLLILGSQADVRNRMLASALAALPAAIEPERIELTLIDGLSPGMPGAGMLAHAADRLERAGARVRIVAPGEIAPAVGDLAASLAGDTPSPAIRLLAIAEPDYLYDLQLSGNRFAPPPDGPASHLRIILERGPRLGLHTLITASGLAAFGNAFSPVREARLFNHRVVQQMNEDDSMMLFASLLAARINEQTEHPFAALLVDQTRGTRAAALFHGYAATKDINGDQDLQALAAQLEAALLGGP